MALTLKLPWPPTVNTYYDAIAVRRRGGRMGMSKKVSDRGKAFKADVFVICRASGELRERFGDARLSMTVIAHPATRRKFDLDNLGKAIQDALCEAGIYDDDSQIDELHFSRREVDKPGYVLVTLEVLPTDMQRYWAGDFQREERNIDKKKEDSNGIHD